MWLLLGILLVLLVLLYVAYGAYKVIRLDTQAYSKYWNELAREPVQPGAIRLLAFGDSTAQAVGASKPRLGTVGRIVTYLEQQTNRPVHVTNLSVSGAKAVDVADKQLSQADFSAVDLVVIAVGANDANKLSDLAVFKKSIEKIVSTVPADKTIMADVAFVRHRPPYQDILEAARAKAGIRRANLAMSFRAVTQAWRMTARDFFHPSNYGYRFWFGAFKPELDKFIAERNLHE